MTLQVGPTRCMCGGVPRARGGDRTAEATSGDQPITMGSGAPPPETQTRATALRHY